MSAEAFGELIGKHPITVSKYRTGKQIPRADAMQQIVKATGGEVRPSDFYPEATTATASKQASAA